MTLEQALARIARCSNHDQLRHVQQGLAAKFYGVALTMNGKDASDACAALMIAVRQRRAALPRESRPCHDCGSDLHGTGAGTCIEKNQE